MVCLLQALSTAFSQEKEHQDLEHFLSENKFLHTKKIESLTEM